MANVEHLPAEEKDISMTQNEQPGQKQPEQHQIGEYTITTVEKTRYYPNITLAAEDVSCIEQYTTRKALD
jgi:hypothetical protein